MPLTVIAILIAIPLALCTALNIAFTAHTLRSGERAKPHQNRATVNGALVAFAGLLILISLLAVAIQN